MRKEPTYQNSCSMACFVNGKGVMFLTSDKGRGTERAKGRQTVEIFVLRWTYNCNERIHSNALKKGLGQIKVRSSMCSIATFRRICNTTNPWTHAADRRMYGSHALHTASYWPIWTSSAVFSKRRCWLLVRAERAWLCILLDPSYVNKHETPKKTNYDIRNMSSNEMGCREQFLRNPTWGVNVGRS